MTIQDAIEQGYTREVFAESGCLTLDLLVQPDADLDDCFRAYEITTREWLNVNGWLFTYEFPEVCNDQ